MLVNTVGTTNAVESKNRSVKLEAENQPPLIATMAVREKNGSI